MQNLLEMGVKIHETWKVNFHPKIDLRTEQSVQLICNLNVSK